MNNQAASTGRQPQEAEEYPCTVLSAAELFQDLSERELAEIEHALSMRKVEKGHIIYMPEDTGEVLFVLRQGRVQLYRLSSDGRKLVLSILGPGSIFGEMSIIGQGMHETFAEALENSVLCVMGRHDVERLILNKPQVALRLVTIIGKRLMEAESRLRDLAFKSVSARLASLLLKLADEDGHQIEGFTHQELSEMVGTYRETTTQTLNDFRNQNLISIARKRITILDPEGLRRRAED